MKTFITKRILPVIKFLAKLLLVLVGIYIIVMIVSLAIDTPGFMATSEKWSHTKAVDIAMQNILLVITAYIFLTFALKRNLKTSYKLSLIFVLAYIPLCIYLLWRLFWYEQWILNFWGTMGSIFMVVFWLSVVLAFVIDIISLSGNRETNENPKPVDKRLLSASIICILVFFVRMMYLTSM